MKSRLSAIFDRSVVTRLLIFPTRFLALASPSAVLEAESFAGFDGDSVVSSVDLILDGVPCKVSSLEGLSSVSVGLLECKVTSESFEFSATWAIGSTGDGVDSPLAGWDEVGEL